MHSKHWFDNIQLRRVYVNFEEDIDKFGEVMYWVPIERIDDEEDNEFSYFVCIRWKQSDFNAKRCLLDKHSHMFRNGYPMTLLENTKIEEQILKELVADEL